MWKVLSDSILSNILEIIATIISLVVAYYVIPYIKSDLIPLLKEKHIYNTVKKFVQAAEKMAESGMIEKVDKKVTVIKLLEKNNIKITETIDAFNESCVKELDMVDDAIYEEIMGVDGE